MMYGIVLLLYLQIQRFLYHQRRPTHVFNCFGSCASLTSISCVSGTSLAATTLTVGATYFVRIYTDPSTISASNTFNICVTHTGPTNDNCAGAITLTSNTGCINTAGTLNLATANAATPLGCFAAGTYYDVWYT